MFKKDHKPKESRWQTINTLYLPKWVDVIVQACYYACQFRCYEIFNALAKQNRIRDRDTIHFSCVRNHITAFKVNNTLERIFKFPLVILSSK